MSADTAAKAQRAAPTAWISRGFEELVASRDPEPAPEKVDFDVVIVGSGYGGAIAAARLAGAMDKVSGVPIRVCILERGREYLPGMFPPRLADLAGHVRFSPESATCARGDREGLFDVRVGADVSAIVANGLGGGSLINAGVMEEPVDAVFAREEWPAEIRNESPEERRKRFAKVRLMLGAALPVAPDKAVNNTVLLNPGKVPAKYRALERMAGGHPAKPFRDVPITIALTAERESSAGVRLDECLRCGDCATGCNHGAKDSLDVNLLRTAERAGAVIYTGATVLRLERRRIGDVIDPRDTTYASMAAGPATDTEVDAWLLDVVHTDANLRLRQGGPFRLVARRVILAAGTFGSTEILLRSRTEDLVFGTQLGQRFSTNGDMIAVAYDQHDPAGARVDVNAIADERLRPRERAVGPTITGMVDLRNADGSGVVIEELAVPGPLRRLFEEVVTTGQVLRELGRIDRDDHVPAGPAHDPCAISGDAIRSSSIVAVMGDDGAGGAIELCGGDAEADGDSAVRVRWSGGRDHPIFGAGIAALRALGRDSGIAGSVQPNPAWQLLPDDMQFLFDNKRGPLLTVHPLGGCPMGDTAHEEEAKEETDDERGRKVGDGGPNIRDDRRKVRLKPLGVVNAKGQVWNGAARTQRDALFRNLVVLDGSIVPTALGINPSLTIAALALRAIDLLHLEWGLTPPGKAVAEPSVRPAFKVMPDPVRDPEPTKVEIVERMSGEAVLLAREGGTIQARVELTLCFKPVTLEQLLLPACYGGEHPQPARRDEPNVGHVAPKRLLTVDPARSQLRIFSAKDWNDWRLRAGRDEELDAVVQFAAPLSGELAFFHREASTLRQRRCRAIPAWFWNRGLRDTWQALAQWIRDTREGVPQPSLAPAEGDRREWPICGKLPFFQDACKRITRRIQELIALASHAGEVRLFEYTLAIGEPVKKAPAPAIDVAPFDRARAIAGRKRITYSRRGNPWWQMMRMSLDTFPGLAASTPPTLELDTTYLTQQRVPLMRVLAQQDEPSVLADLGSLVGYFLRLLMSVHVWSFRKPDPAAPGEPQRLPGKLPRLPGPDISEFVVAHLPNGRPVRARLTRYPRRASTKPPLLLIPGYSASGTTYAHPALDPHAAGYFWKRGRDVWILDMRTSCGMPTARMPWAFEEAALADIPAAVEQIWNATGGRQKIDVFAHCMGSVMFGMALLAPPEAGDPFFRERESLPDRIGRVVLSQIGPVVVFTPANTFRAYLMSYLRVFLPLQNYEFRIGPAPSLADQLIDRALATLPYPDEEFDVENPWWPPWRRTPWVGSRHRMDALYGRDFNVENVRRKALNRIDDLFGPLSTDTVAQVIHFARLGVTTNSAGRNVFVSRRNLLERWRRGRPTLSLHGVDNGLYDIATLARMKKLFKDDLGLDYTPLSFPNLGHQDSLIGRRAGEVFAAVEAFLERAEER